jgi:hypothetical protein
MDKAGSDDYCTRIVDDLGAGRGRGMDALVSSSPQPTPFISHAFCMRCTTRVARAPTPAGNRTIDRLAR